MLKVEIWPVERLIPYARNPRKNDGQVDRMVSSIREFGFRIPVVAKSDGTVVDGHLRLKAAKKLGIKEIPVALADELTQSQAKAFRLLANRSANWAEWDNELLQLEIEDLQAVGFDLELVGFDAGELEVLTGDITRINLKDNNKYSSKIATPIYEPTGKIVELNDLCKSTYTDNLLKRIDAANVSEDEKIFLRKAATRHIVFNYQNIAEYYSSASKEMQQLMEESVLVIIDINNSIKNGFVEFSENIKKIMDEAA